MDTAIDEPQKPVDGGDDGEEDRGEAGMIFSMLTELRYGKLSPQGWYEGLPQKKTLAEDGQPSLFIPGPGKAAIAKVSPSLWMDVRAAYSERLLRTRPCRGRGPMNIGTVPWSDEGDGLPQPGIPGANNWIPIGPAAIRRGQATGSPAVSGRTLRIAIAPGGNRVYVATADGGVWRSDNGGVSWKSTMDGFDQNPTAFASTSTACGAIAIDLNDPDRVYVGTGEGDTFEIWSLRLTNALPSYHGIGAIRSDDGGKSWNVETTASGSTSLTGSAFYALAVDPADRENVIGATTVGLYRREPDSVGGYHWVQKQTGVSTSVIACGDGISTTTLYAAQQKGPVSTSIDGGVTWVTAGTGFPSGVSRITLGARPSDASVLYALVESGGGFGLYRLDGGSGPWRQVNSLPALGGQPDYNLALTVDPNDANTVYVAGQVSGGDGSIFRCVITSSGSGGSLTYSMTSTFIGKGVHADVHALLNAPGDSSTLWVCCDGGVWRTQTPTVNGSFVHRNAGLATLCGNFFSQHPTQPAVITLGLQDNGVARYTGEECWTHISDGDGGYTVINWADPTQVLVSHNGTVLRATDDGQSPASFNVVLAPGWFLMTPPLVGTPYNPTSPSDANTVAYGDGTQLFISTDFGATWPSAVATLSQNIFALTFESPNRLYVGTTLGQVIRFDKSGATWTQTRIDNAPGGALGVSGIVTDIEVDLADTSGLSVYASFGGFGDQRHVWHYDGTQWQSRSGTGATGLLDVEHNAIVVDPTNTSTVFVGTDVGVWRSVDAGSSWAPFEAGLPDSAVLDLQIHPTARLLRASTYGRGMFELKLDPPAQADVELYVRDTSLDVGRGITVDNIPDPEIWPSQPVFHWQSRNIKVDVPTPAGYQTPTSNIDFVVFNDIIQDGSEQTVTLDPTTGTVVNRVYVEVHNRGIVEVASVNVMLLLANASTGLPPLPAGYETNVQNGTPISTAVWQTVGIQIISNLNVAFPQVAAFKLPSTMLPPPSSLPGQSHYCVLALLHCPEDSFTNTETNTDNLTITDRKVALRNLHIVPFVGTPPPPQDGTWERLDIYRHRGDERQKELVIAGASFVGRVLVLLPPDLKVESAIGFEQCERPDFVDKWAEKHTAKLRDFMKHGRFSFQACQQMLLDIRRVSKGRMFSVEAKRGLAGILRGLCLEPGKRYPFFVYFEPTELAVGKPRTVDVVVRDVDGGCVQGGSVYKLALVEDQE